MEWLILSFLCLILTAGSALAFGSYLFVLGNKIGNYIGGTILYITAILISILFVLLIKDQIRNIKGDKHK